MLLRENVIHNLNAFGGMFVPFESDPFLIVLGLPARQTGRPRSANSGRRRPLRRFLYTLNTSNMVTYIVVITENKGNKDLPTGYTLYIITALLWRTNEIAYNTNHSRWRQSTYTRVQEDEKIELGNELAVCFQLQ